MNGYTIKSVKFDAYLPGKSLHQATAYFNNGLMVDLRVPSDKRNREWEFYFHGSGFMELYLYRGFSGEKNLTEDKVRKNVEEMVKTYLLCLEEEENG
jgi:hypothetical protein